MNLNKLVGKMAEMKKTNAKMAELLEISERAFSNKRTGKNEFTASEIVKMAEYLDVSVLYFFEQAVIK